MLPYRLACPLNLKTANVGNPGAIFDGPEKLDSYVTTLSKTRPQLPQPSKLNVRRLYNGLPKRGQKRIVFRIPLRPLPLFPVGHF